MATLVTTLIPVTQLTASIATYYTGPTGTITRVEDLTITNTSASPVTVTIYLVAAGGSAITANIVTNAKTVQPSETWKCPDFINKVVLPTSTIQAVASTAGVLNISASGSQFS